jgi:hypothetical protein
MHVKNARLDGSNKPGTTHEHVVEVFADAEVEWALRGLRGERGGSVL